jgi:2-amino-4-hydroxy-6-hydroxymethyldihydropteridine diphosphokinase
MAEPVRAILALGGNLGKRRKTIRSALKALAATPGYLNGVAQIDTTLKPKELLTEIRRIETEHGRIRLERWGSRTLDIDIITYGTELKSGKELTLPHPRAFERAFVVVPWSILDPEAILPGHGSVKALAEDLKDQVWLVK